jgi:4-hydroxy-2-oxoheptanedioate aldolase
MNGTQLRQALHAGKRVYGTLIVSESPRWVQDALPTLGLDFVFIDTEHVALSRTPLSWMCQACSALGIAPIVRIPSPDPYQATMVIDGGAQGVIAPYLETPEQVRQVAGALRLRPLRGLRMQNAIAGTEALEPELAAYVAERREKIVFIANIESVPAMQNLDEILKIEGIDGVLIGPHDLSCSLGIPEQYTNPRYVAAVDEIIARTRAAGKGAGIHLAYPNGLEQEIRWVKNGANFIVHSADILVFRQAMRRELDAIRQAAGDLPGHSGESTAQHI